jgi:hypothetical protein
MAESTPRQAADTINKLGGFQAAVDDQGVVRVKYRGERKPPSTQKLRKVARDKDWAFSATDEAFKHSYPIGNIRGAQAAMGPQGNEGYQRELQQRLAQLEGDRTALHQQAFSLGRMQVNREELSEGIQYIKSALDSLEQEELWTQDELYRSGYVPPEATDIYSHVLQYGAGQELGLIPDD